MRFPQSRPRDLPVCGGFTFQQPISPGCQGHRWRPRCSLHPCTQMINRGLRFWELVSNLHRHSGHLPANVRMTRVLRRNKAGFHQFGLQGKGKAYLDGISGCDVVHHNNQIYFNLYMYMNSVRCYYIQFFDFIVFVMLKQRLVFVALSIIPRKPMMATTLPEMF